MMRALTTGSAVIDIITQMAAGDIEQMSLSNATTKYLWLEQGRKIDAQSVSTHVGGGAINVGVAWQRLGAQVTPIVKIGRDLNGEKISAAMQASNLSTAKLRYSDDVGSGVSVLISAHDRNAGIFTYRGANSQLRPQDFQAEDFAGVDCVFISNLSNESADCYAHIIKLARAAGSKIASNPGIRQLNTRGTQFASSLAGIDLLTMNSSEALACIAFIFDGHKHSTYPQLAAPSANARLWRRGLSKDSMQMPLSEFMARVRARGVAMLCLTDGTHGSYLATDAGMYYCPSHKTKVKGTAGAGDAFAATLSYALFNGFAPQQALAMASLNAAAVVGQLDTQSGLLAKDVLLEQLQQQADKLGVAFQAW